jgi:hypothetical protein
LIEQGFRIRSGSWDLSLRGQEAKHIHIIIFFIDIQGCFFSDLKKAAFFYGITTSRQGKEVDDTGWFF